MTSRLAGYSELSREEARADAVANPPIEWSAPGSANDFEASGAADLFDVPFQEPVWVGTNQNLVCVLPSGPQMPLGEAEIRKRVHMQEKQAARAESPADFPKDLRRVAHMVEHVAANHQTGMPIRKGEAFS